MAGADVTTNREGTDDLAVIGTFEGVHVERTGLCVFDVKGSTSSEGKIDIDGTVQGTDNAGKVINLAVTDS